MAAWGSRPAAHISSSLLHPIPTASLHWAVERLATVQLAVRRRQLAGRRRRHARMLGNGAVRKGLLVSCGVSPVALGSLHPNLKEMIITDIAQGDPFYHLDALHSAKAKEGKDSSSSQPAAAAVSPKRSTSPSVRARRAQ